MAEALGHLFDGKLREAVNTSISVIKRSSNPKVGSDIKDPLLSTLEQISTYIPETGSISDKEKQEITTTVNAGVLGNIAYGAHKKMVESQSLLETQSEKERDILKEFPTQLYDLAIALGYQPSGNPEETIPVSSANSQSNRSNTTISPNRPNRPNRPNISKSSRVNVQPNASTTPLMIENSNKPNVTNTPTTPLMIENSNKPNVTNTPTTPLMIENSNKPNVTNTPITPFVVENSNKPNTPLVTNSSNKPTTPPATNSSIVPRATNSANAPRATNSPNAPRATNSANAPRATNSPNAPRATNSAIVPRATNSPNAPRATNSPNVPRATNSANAPRATNSANVPRATNSANAPRATNSANAPRATNSANKPTGPLMIENSNKPTGPLMIENSNKPTGPLMIENSNKPTGPLMIENIKPNKPTGPLMIENIPSRYRMPGSSLTNLIARPLRQTIKQPLPRNIFKKIKNSTYKNRPYFASTAVGNQLAIEDKKQDVATNVNQEFGNQLAMNDKQVEAPNVSQEFGNQLAMNDKRTPLPSTKQFPGSSHVTSTIQNLNQNKNQTIRPVPITRKHTRGNAIPIHTQRDWGDKTHISKLGKLPELHGIWKNPGRNPSTSIFPRTKIQREVKTRKAGKRMSEKAKRRSV